MHAPALLYHLDLDWFAKQYIFVGLDSFRSPPTTTLGSKATTLKNRRMSIVQQRGHAKYSVNARANVSQGNQGFPNHD